MHYDNDFIINNNELKAVIYKHEVFGSETEEVTYQLCSIQSCKFIHPFELQILIGLFSEEDLNQKDIEEAYPKLKSLKTEVFYLVTFKVNKDFKFEIFEIQEGDLDSNPEIGLH